MRRYVSGSKRSPSGVESIRSVKTTVTVFRISRGAAGPSRGAPHARQNRACAGLASPHRGQAAMSAFESGTKKGLSTLDGRVRHAFRPAPGGSPRRSRPRQARRGRRLARDARDPSRAARGRRQLQGRQGLRGARARPFARRRGDEEPHARPGGRADRPRGADGPDGQRRLEARLRRQAADGDPARGAPGLGQDDRRREARPALAEGGSLAGARRRRPRSAPRRSSSSSSSAASSRSRSSRPRIRSAPSARESSRPATRARTWSSSTRPAGSTSTRR